MNRKAKLVKRLLVSTLVVILILVIGAIIYINDYYRASNYVDTLIDKNNSRIVEDGQYTYIKPKDKLDEPIGLIFYPGGKVESTAYIPLLLKLADRGVTPILVDMPGNLAVFNIDAAEDIFKSYEDIDIWYIAGHSLGGAM